MTNRLTGFLMCAIPGLLMLAGGLAVPAHLRAVDAAVLQRAGRNTPALFEQGLALVRENNLGAAQLLLQAGQEAGLPDRQRLGLAIANLATQHPSWMVWGGGDARLERLFASDPELPRSGSEPFTNFMVREQNRAVVLDLLRASPLPVVQELLRCRALTNTVIFSPSQSASGQAFDTALAVCGLLLEGGHLNARLSDAVSALAQASNRGGDPQRLEQVLLDLMSLGQRFNWGQLLGFVGRVQDPETLRLLVNLVRKSDGQLPVLFTVVQLSGQPAQAAAYLMKFNETGLKDLGASLRFGAGGLDTLLRREQRLYGGRAGCAGACGRGSRFGGGFVLADAVAGADYEVVIIPGGGVLARCGAAFCAPGGLGSGAAAAGARVSYGPRDAICAGIPARGVAPERAVSRPGKPESGVSFSTAPAHGGQRCPGGNPRR